MSVVRKLMIAGASVPVALGLAAPTAWAHGGSLGSCIDRAVESPHVTSAVSACLAAHRAALGSANDGSATVNTGILGSATDGGVNTGILGTAAGDGAVNTAILGSASA